MEVNIECPHCGAETKINTDHYDQPYDDLRHLCGCCDELIAFGLELNYVAVLYEVLPLHESATIH